MGDSHAKFCKVRENRARPFDLIIFVDICPYGMVGDACVLLAWEIHMQSSAKLRENKKWPFGVIIFIAAT